MNRRVDPAACWLLALVGCAGVLAQEAPPGEPAGAPPAEEPADEVVIDEQEGDEEGQHVAVVVTASKHGQKITEAPAAVTVMTSEDIQATGALNVADLFRRIPGLDFMQVGARDYNVNARGFNNTLSRRLLVLIDGRSVYLDLLGFTLWDGLQLNLDDIERIEVVRGPGSALYGANASSGVVNIITKSPEAVGGTVLRAGYGEWSTIDGGVLHGGTAGPFGYKVAASYYQTDAFENPDKDPDSEFQQEGEVATRQPKGMFRFQYDVPGTAGSSRLEVDGGYGATSGTLYTGIGPLEIQPGSYSPFVRAAFTRGDFFVQAFWNGLVGETYNLTSLQTNHFTTDAYDVEAQYNRQLGRHYLVLGANVRVASIASDLTSRDETELNGGVYGQDEIELGKKVTANLAFRVDRDDLVGAVFAPKGGIVYHPDERSSLRLTFATAYNSSSFIESYLDYVVKIPLTGGGTLDIDAHGNDELRPEKVTSFEVGYRSFPREDLLLDVNVFYSRLKDFVQFIATDYYAPGLPRSYSYVNAGEATQAGLELSAELYATEHLGIFANYSYTDTEQDEEVSDVSAAHKAALTLQYVRKKGFTGSLGVVYSSKLEFPPSTAFYQAGVIPSYTVVNGAACWAFLEDGALSIGVRGTNLLDKRHREFIAGDVIERKVVAEVKVRF